VITAINSDAPEYVSAATLAQNLPRWRGRPVMLGHPEKDGRMLSAEDPGVRAARQVGKVANARSDGRRLLMEIAIDPARCEALGAHEMLHRLRTGQHVEVSVGVFAATDMQAGRFNGRGYTRSWTSMFPDHLALLPDGAGACSYPDCGTHRAAATYFQHSEGAQRMKDYTPPDPYAAALAERLDADDPSLIAMRAATDKIEARNRDARTLQQMRSFRDQVIRTSVISLQAAQHPTESGVHTHPPNPYNEAALQKWREGR
jgi:hypothetical protein